MLTVMCPVYMWRERGKVIDCLLPQCGTTLCTGGDLCNDVEGFHGLFSDAPYTTHGCSIALCLPFAIGFVFAAGLCDALVCKL